MKNKKLALVGLLVLILAGASFVLFSGKTTLFKGQFGGPFGEDAEEDAEEDCIEDDRGCWGQLVYQFEDQVVAAEGQVLDAKQSIDEQQAIADEKKAALERQARVVKANEASVQAAKRRVQNAEKALKLAQKRRSPRAIAAAEAALRSAEAALEDAQRNLQIERTIYNELKQEFLAAEEELRVRVASYERLNNELIRLRNRLKGAREALEHAWEVFVPDWRFCYDFHQLSFETELPDIYDAPLEKCQDLFPEVMTEGPNINRCARMKQKEMDGVITPSDRRFLDNCRAAYPFAFDNLSVERCEEYRQWAEERTLTYNNYDPPLLTFCGAIYPDIMRPGSEEVEEPIPAASHVPTPLPAEPPPPPSEELPSEPEPVPSPDNP